MHMVEAWKKEDNMAKKQEQSTGDEQVAGTNKPKSLAEAINFGGKNKPKDEKEGSSFFSIFSKKKAKKNLGK